MKLNYLIILCITVFTSYASESYNSLVKQKINWCDNTFQYYPSQSSPDIALKIDYKNSSALLAKEASFIFDDDMIEKYSHELKDVEILTCKIFEKHPNKNSTDLVKSNYPSLIASILKNNSNLTALSLQNNIICSDYKLIADAIFDYTDNTLSEALKSHTSLHFLHLDATTQKLGLGNAIIKSLPSLTSLKALCLSGNNIIRFEDVFNFISKTPHNSLQALYLSNCLLSNEEIIACTELIRNSQSILSIDLSNPRFSIIFDPLFFDAIKETNSSLTELNLFGCNLHTAIKNLSAMIFTNTNLTDLNVGKNKLKNEGIALLCNAIAENPLCAITKLDISQNNLSIIKNEDEALIAIVNMIAKNSKLIYFNISGPDNYLGLIGIDSLCDAITTNSQCALQKINLSNATGIIKHALQLFKDKLSSNTTIFDIGFIPLTLDSVYWATAMKLFLRRNWKRQLSLVDLAISNPENY